MHQPDRLRFGLLAAVTFVALVISATPAWACVCGHPSSPSNEFGSSTAVFTGTALSVERSGPTRSAFGAWLFSLGYRFGLVSQPAYRGNERRITFAVRDAWKGVDDENVTVTTMDGACGYDFVVGEDYLVYAPGGSNLQTSKCFRTRTLAMSAEDFAFLKKMPMTVFSGSSLRSSKFPYIGMVMGGGVILMLIVEWVIRRRPRPEAH